MIVSFTARRRGANWGCPFSEETWRSILAAIVGYELVKIYREKPSKPTIEELETVPAKDRSDEIDLRPDGQVVVRGDTHQLNKPLTESSP